MLDLFAGAHQAFPIGEIAGETQLASSLPSRPRQCGVPFSAFRIMQISIAAPCAVDVRRKWVAMRFHVGYERFDLLGELYGSSRLSTYLNSNLDFFGGGCRT